MKKPLKIALLVSSGTMLLVISHVTTSYDRGDIATLEQLLGFLLLLLAGGLSLVKMGDPIDTKPVKVVEAPAESAAPVPSSETPAAK